MKKYRFMTPEECLANASNVASNCAMAMGLLADAELFLSKEIYAFLVAGVSSGELDPHALPKEFFPRLLTLGESIKVERSPGRAVLRDTRLWLTYLLHYHGLVGDTPRGMMQPQSLNDDYVEEPRAKPKRGKALDKLLMEAFGVTKEIVDGILTKNKRLYPDWQKLST